MDRIIDPPNMTLVVDRGCKALTLILLNIHRFKFIHKTQKVPVFNFYIFSAFE